jgi:hypothetical protein
MTQAQFRRLALALAGATEGGHMGHADFRHGAKIFATLGYPDADFGTVKLTPDQQAMLVETAPKVFTPVSGGWGRRGYTNVRLAQADGATLEHALTLAWQNCAPKGKRANAKDKSAVRKDKSAARGEDKGATRGIDAAFARARKAAKAAGLPGIAEGTSYGTPSLTVAGKFLMRVKDADTLVFRCTLEEKTFLMEAEPAIYFETDHYVGWAAVLVRVAAASDAELAHCVKRAWRLQAPKKLLAGHSASRPAGRRKSLRKESSARKSSRARTAPKA